MKKLRPITIVMQLEMHEVTSVSIALDNYLNRCLDRKEDEPDNCHWEETEGILRGLIAKFDKAFDDSPEVKAEKEIAAKL